MDIFKKLASALSMSDRREYMDSGLPFHLWLYKKAETNGCTLKNWLLKQLSQSIPDLKTRKKTAVELVSFVRRLFLGQIKIDDLIPNVIKARPSTKNTLLLFVVDYQGETLTPAAVLGRLPRKSDADCLYYEYCQLYLEKLGFNDSLSCCLCRQSLCIYVYEKNGIQTFYDLTEEE